MSLYSL